MMARLQKKFAKPIQPSTATTLSHPPPLICSEPCTHSTWLPNPNPKPRFDLYQTANWAKMSENCAATRGDFWLTLHIIYSELRIWSRLFSM